MISKSAVRPFLFSAFLLAAATAQAATVYTTWTDIDLAADTATGSLGAVTITLAGTGTSPGDLSYFEANSGYWFSIGAGLAAPLPVGNDRLDMGGLPGPARQFTLTFSSPVLDPILQLASVGSVLTFTDGVSSLTRLPGIISNDGNFSVSGLTVTSLSPVIDAFGTVRLDGLISSVTFTQELRGTDQSDGLPIQVGVDAAVVPAPGTLVLLLTALVAAATRRSVQRR